MGCSLAATRIAVSYDDAIYLDLLHERLTAAGYDIHLIRGQGGKMPYQRMRDLDPGLIILDIHLHRSEAGWRLLDKVQRDPVLGTTPVIVCAADLREVERYGVACGRPDGRRVALLPKPFEMEELLALVQRLLGDSP